jgi:flagellar export protein FliJ
MKTKFTPLVDVRKRAVDNVEQQLATLNLHIQNTIELVSQIENQILTSPMPTSGTFFEISCAKELVHTHRRELKTQQIVLMQLQDDKNRAQQELKSAYIEFEKAKHLDDLEKQKIIKDRKAKENAYMDEIALMLHNTKKK